MVSPAALRASSTSPTAPEQPRTIRPDADPRSGRFIVLEGLAAVGKSTIAPLLAAALDAELVETQLPEFTQARRYMDEQRSVNARLHFWMMANYAVSDIVREHLRTGRDVVIESYFYRTLATHAAMGARQLPEVDWGRAAAPNLAIELTLREPHRQRRLAERRAEAADEVCLGEMGDRRHGADVERLDVEWGTPADPATLAAHLAAHEPYHAVLVTHNETSTGVANPVRELAAAIRQAPGDPLRPQVPLHQEATTSRCLPYGAG